MADTAQPLSADAAETLIIADLLQLFSSPVGIVAVTASIVAATIVLKQIHNPSQATPRNPDTKLVDDGTCLSNDKPRSTEGDNGAAEAESKDSQKQREPIRLPKDLREHLDGKDYAAALEEVLQNTALRPADLDPKVLRLLDMLEMKGTSRAACRRLREALEGKARQRIDNWRSYAYSLVRSYDPEAYQRMKDNGNDDRPKPTREKAEKADAVTRRRKERKKHPVSNFDFRCSAPEFIPGIARHGQSEGALSEGASADARAEALLEELASPLLSR
jgi:hypothetical protein|mmetsp:Transcript_98696/g.155984  ORF Transcript_98696/g.155984 Transcript_98696/m.155984 type:complete len:275 (+) Transcript_98696:36-860(+)